jgi:hypothetical protein
VRREGRKSADFEESRPHPVSGTIALAAAARRATPSPRHHPPAAPLPPASG